MRPRLAARTVFLLCGPLLVSEALTAQPPNAERLARELADLQRQREQLRQTQALLDGGRLVYWPRLSGGAVVFDALDRSTLNTRLNQQAAAGLLTAPAATELASLAQQLANAARESLQIAAEAAAVREAAKRRELAVAQGSPVGPAAVSPAGRAPGWSRGQQLLSITYDECVGRARTALQVEGYRIDHAGGNFAVGVKGAHTAVIMCNPVGAKEVVNIVVMSNGDGGGDQRGRLQTRMEGPSRDETPPAPPMSQGATPQVGAQPPLGPDRDGWTFNSSTATNLRFFGSASAASCRAECEKESKCMAFSWIKPAGYQPGDPPMCYLLSSWAGLVQHPCCISAVRN